MTNMTHGYPFINMHKTCSLTLLRVMYCMNDSTSKKQELSQLLKHMCPIVLFAYGIANFVG